MNFLFVDRILSLEPGKRTVGLKHITPRDNYLTQGTSGQPVLLTAILGETLGQLCAWNVIHRYDFKLRPVAGVVDQVTIYDEAVVGDTVLLESVIDRLDEQAVYYHSVATVRGKKIFTIDQALGPMLPMDTFNDPEEVKAQFKLLHRPGEFTDLPAPEMNCHLDTAGLPVQEDYDHLLLWERGVSLVAQKNVSLQAPYFVDHFPRKPVLPMTILLSCKLALAKRFLDDMLGPQVSAQFKPHQIRRIKMNEFVSPGESVVTTLKLKSQTSEEIRLQFSSVVDGKRVCVAEAIMRKG